MRRALFLALALLASGAPAQTMHKCVDARGVTHYSDKPLAGCKSVEVRIEAQPPISGTPPQSKEDFRRDENEFQRRRIAEERSREKEAKALEEQRRLCDTLQANLQRLQSGLRIVRPDDKGGYEYLEDEERNQNAAKLRDEIAQKCR